MGLSNLGYRRPEQQQYARFSDLLVESISDNASVLISTLLIG